MEALALAISQTLWKEDMPGNAARLSADLCNFAGLAIVSIAVCRCTNAGPRHGQEHCAILVRTICEKVGSTPISYSHSWITLPLRAVLIWADDDDDTCIRNQVLGPSRLADLVAARPSNSDMGPL